jgi:hypothetical protein
MVPNMEGGGEEGGIFQNEQNLNITHKVLNDPDGPPLCPFTIYAANSFISVAINDSYVIYTLLVYL